LIWFEDKPRHCAHCSAPLWTDARIKATQAKYPQIPFATWSKLERLLQVIKSATTLDEVRAVYTSPDA